MPARQHQTPPPGIIFIEDYTDDDGNVTRGIASRLGISVSAYRKWRMAGKGPKTFPLGKKVAAREEAVDEWLTEQAGAPIATQHESRPPEPRISKRPKNKAA